MVSGQAAHATWLPDGVSVVPDIVPNPEEMHIVTDGAGGAMVVWIDSRNGIDLNRSSILTRTRHCLRK